jgi:hypothetical protein
MADPDGFLGMGADETLVHAWDIAQGLGVPFDPPRELAWQLFHDLKSVPKPGWLEPLLPRPAAVLYDDPFALMLAAMATGLAAAYAIAAVAGAAPRVRATLIAIGATLLLGLPTVGFIALGLATGRPYGHDGGVVQLPLALDRVLAGLSPYGADYSASVLGWQSRSSVFWAPLGGNPIVRHHWYLPGVHLAMAPFYVLCRNLFGFFDPRLVTMAAYGAAIDVNPMLRAVNLDREGHVSLRVGTIVEPLQATGPPGSCFA